MKISLSSYGSYSSNNYGANSMLVSVGSLDLYFSYKTVVAFRTIETGLVISENVWSTTTGKHLNWIDPDKSKRLSRSQFEIELDKMLKKHKLQV